ncbi:MAG TPA: phosphonoacetaldehyde reductase [Ignavibacteria bacterium]|nr:phosphonoacetaldehyde reductase [Ignavibacteria bacterium]
MKQTEFSGAGCIENLKEILEKINSKNIFLVAGKNSYRTSGAEKILSEIILKDKTVTFFNDVTGDPLIETIIKGMDIFIESECDAVIAVGGGSVIDTAKSINILSSQDADPRSVIKGEVKIVNMGKPLIAIPTTSGAGSEATHFAVVYMKKEKYSLAHEYILPDYSIVDPVLTYHLQPNVTATSGIDAFSQSVESYWNVNANEESKRYSKEAITLILNNLNTAVNEPTKESRANMSAAAHLAGKAINITKTTAPHAVSYAMTSYFGIPHGQAVCITLAEFLEYNYNVTETDSAEGLSMTEVRNNIKDLIRLFNCSDPAQAKKLITDLIGSIGLKIKLSELNITSENDLKLICESVNLERLKNNPRNVTKESIAKILESIL